MTLTERIEKIEARLGMNLSTEKQAQKDAGMLKMRASQKLVNEEIECCRESHSIFEKEIEDYIKGFKNETKQP